MPGFKFTSDLRTEDECIIDSWNIGTRGTWGDAIIAAEETAILDNAQCPFDEDGECAKRGCLNEYGVRGWRMSLNDFIAMNERTLAFVKAHPEKLPDRTICRYQDGTEDKQPGAVNAIPLLEGFINRLREIGGKGGKVVTMWDRLSDPDFYACPREFSTKRSPNANEIEESLKQGIAKPGAIIGGRIVPYDEAREKQKNGEWEANQKEVWSSD